MARRLLALGVVGLLLSGCVSRDQYEAVKLERNSLAEQLATAQSGSSADRAANRDRSAPRRCLPTAISPRCARANCATRPPSSEVPM